jgi:RecB family exonuclease
MQEQALAAAPAAAAFPPNSSFHPEIPGLQLAWDSTSLGALKTCPRLYYYSIIQGWTPRITSVHLVFGQVYHSALEAYDRARSQGLGHVAATREAVHRALLDTWDKAMRRPWFSDDSNKNRLTLLRSVVWYLEQFQDDPLQTVQLASGKPAVELSFRFVTSYSAPDGAPYLLCGHLDRLVTDPNGKTWVLDRKTTKSTVGQDFFDKFTPDNQFTLYALASHIVYATPVQGLIVDGAQIAITFSRFLRGIVLRQQSQLDEWYEGLAFWLAQAELFAKRQTWPQNDKACQNYGGCPFRPICAKPPSVREQWLRGSNHKRIWDPLQVRGDI